MSSLYDDIFKEESLVPFPNHLLEDCGVIKYFLSGSRAICPDKCSPIADWDYVVLVESIEKFIEAAESGDYVDVTRTNEKYKDLSCAILYNEEINLTVYEDEKMYKRWQLATKVAIHAKAVTRDMRVAIFKEILYAHI